MTRTTATGYSGTPLARKLGIKEASVVCVLGAPMRYPDLLDQVPRDVRFARTATARVDLVHVFVRKASLLEKELVRLRKALRPDACIWVSWPKKASGVPTDITEDTIRSLALPMGFVDVKVCAVTEVWSGLKLMIRKSLRPA